MNDCCSNDANVCYTAVGMKSKQTWFWLALLSFTLAAPNAMVMRYAVGELDPFLLNALRFAIVALCCAPIIWQSRGFLTGKALRSVLIAGAAMSVAALTFTVALVHSTASYVSILLLLTPVVLVFYSNKLTGERISRRAMAGITLSALGAAVIVLLPLALRQNTPFTFYPLATLLCVLNCLIYPLSTIEIKKANEDHGVPMFALVGFVAGIVTVANVIAWLLSGSSVPASVSWQTVAGILYSALIISLFGRALGIWSYERVGSAVISALTYFEALVAVILPVIFLHEKVSLEMAIGGCLILFGVFVVEYHKSTHHKHHHAFRAH